MVKLTSYCEGDVLKHGSLFAWLVLKGQLNADEQSWISSSIEYLQSMPSTGRFS